MSEALPKIDVVARAEALDGLVAELVELSHPLFSYTELKSMLRAHYHRHVNVCMDAGLASRELAAVAGLTKPGLRGLDDARPFRMGRNALRMLYVWIKESGEAGASRGGLAQRYYDELSPQARKNVGLEVGLDVLVRSGDVVERDGVFCAAVDEDGPTLAEMRDVLDIVQRHGPLNLGELGRRFHETGQRRGLDDTVEALQEAGEIQLQHGQYAATVGLSLHTQVGGVPEGTVHAIVQTVREVGRAVMRPTGAGDAQLVRYSFPVAGEQGEVARVLERMRSAVVSIASEEDERSEGAEGPVSVVTVVVGGMSTQPTPVKL